MSDEKLNSNCERLQKAANFLEKALSTPEDDVQRAAVIQAFEMCFELSWRLMKAWLAVQGVESLSPREAIREAARLGLIDNPAAWLGFLDTRNLSSHTYNEDNAIKAYTTIKSLFLKELKELLSRVKA